ncbi:unnamed protein product [Spodoptera littoralis]|uniref:G-protein coupled receptors family 2 profile 2 domain-containing protein n=1 Tax=Spodoptera littoralis TaxID=7109 RepID=A0A9P0IDM4_SPOLI|nr:unnamed protein product [Spodoptera littoralis]CAH1643951.1 unnamed protein product [Spodoptera littoralis]
MSDSDVHYSRISVPNTTAFNPPLVSVVVEYLVLVMTLVAFIYGAISWCLLNKFRHFRNFVYINAVVSSLLRLLTVSIIIPCVMQVIVIDDQDIMDICRYICTYFSAVQNYWMLVICYIFYVDIVKVFRGHGTEESARFFYHGRQHYSHCQFYGNQLYKYQWSSRKKIIRRRVRDTCASGCTAMFNNTTHILNSTETNSTSTSGVFAKRCILYAVVTISSITFIIGVVSWILIKKFRHFRNYIFLSIIFNNIVNLLMTDLIKMIKKSDRLEINMTGGVLFLYFRMSAYCWLTILCWIFYVDLVKVFNTEVSKKYLKISLFAWGVPIVITVFSTVVMPHIGATGDNAAIIFNSILFLPFSATQAMALFTYILLTALHATLAQDCVINNIPERMAFEKQLRKDLKCNYKIFEHPPQNSSSFPVKVKFVMKKFSFNTEEDTFSVQTRMSVSWNDPRLQWNPEKYYGIDVTEMSIMNIWAPTITLVNSVSPDDFNDRYYFARCNIYSDGEVTCMRRVTHDAACNVNLTHWPYDQQECSLIFEAADSKSLNIQINSSSRVFSMWGAEYGAEWTMADYKQESNYTSNKRLKLTFVVEREATGLAAIVFREHTEEEYESSKSAVILPRFGCAVVVINATLVCVG